MNLKRSLVCTLLLIVAGYAHGTRDTWTRVDTQLQSAHLACLEYSNRDDVLQTTMSNDKAISTPLAFVGAGSMRTSGGGGTFGRAIRRKIYKSCMEERGYVKTRTEEFSLSEGDPCGTSDQTCTRDPAVTNPFGYRRAY